MDDTSQPITSCNQLDKTVTSDLYRSEPQDQRTAAESVGIEITVFEKKNGILSKRISLSSDMTELRADGSECIMYAGRARRMAFSCLEEFASYVGGMPPNCALALGTLAEGVPQDVRLTCARNLPSRRGDQHVIARNTDYLGYRPDTRGLLLIDFDRKGMPPAFEERLTVNGGAWGTIISVCPELAAAGHVRRASTSSGIINSETGISYPGSGGEHIYVAVRDAADIPRALSVLFDRLWLAGYGWVRVSKAGQVLHRSLVDASVSGPERLVFEGAPVLVPPLQQDALARQPVAYAGTHIDTRLALPDLSAAEKIHLTRLRAQAEASVAEEARATRQRRNRELATEISERKNISFASAMRIAEARLNYRLLPDIPLHFDNPDLGEVTVGAVLAEPERFCKATLADPLEGPSYGRCKAMVMEGHKGGLVIHSFAHGSAVYRLLHDARSVELLLDNAPRAELVEVACTAITQADLQADEEDRILKDVAKRTGGSLSAIKKRLKSEQQRALGFGDELQRDESDLRVRLPAPGKDAEFTPTLRALDAVLMAVESGELPMRNAEGRLCVVRLKSIPGLSELGGAKGASKSAPPEPVIQVLSIEEATILIERHAAFVSGQRRGENEKHERLQKSHAKAYSEWAGSKLPVVYGVANLPLVLPNGELTISGRIDPDTQYFFQLDELVRKALPKPGDVSETAARAAFEFLRDDWLCDVATSLEDKAVAIALALTLIQRPLLAERPAFVVSAGQRGGGKTTLLNMLSIAVFGRRAAAAQWCDHEEERRKSLFSYFRDGAAMILFDNVPSAESIKCPHIEAALTSPTISSRILGVSERQSVPSTTVIVFTGNNISPAGDMCSRALTITLMSERPDPENREFKRPDPFGWTMENRTKILNALYSILMWNAQRLQRQDAPSGTRFKQWMRHCGSAVEVLSGINFAERFRAGEAVDEQVGGIAALLVDLRAKFQDRPFTSNDLLEAYKCPEFQEVHLQTALEAATSKPLDPRKDLTALMVGKRLQMIKGRPVAAKNLVYTLTRVADPHANSYYVKCTNFEPEGS